MTHPSPLHTLRGYVEVVHSPTGELGVGGYSNTNVDELKQRSTGVVTNMKRVRDIARRFHNWDVPSEADLRREAMRGGR
ncbi:MULTISPECIES: hypothetical protein [unclassified Haloarcula]|jgi:hypothetical protein|uniref:hypothetical protein n=1 Tax=unclassified Haloarcula TaxID=2624677 RepID=UPI000EF165E5|nr:MULTISPECIES: hypothetical protein [unclassified Haloarcula]MDT3437799.1 hypothetical protein [Haloarcula sp. 1CSR25-25]RLM94330.1 hypothetical protein D3D01_15830 [Haloarcula sp. Atlit-7R]